MSTFRTATAGVLALGIALATAGCAPAPSPAPSVEPVAIEPTVTPSPEPVPDAPQPTIGVTCAELLSTATIAATMPAGVAPIDPSVSRLAGLPLNAYGIFDAVYVRASGGLACEWSNGQPQVIGDEYVGVRVLVLPDAAAAFSRFSRELSHCSEVVPVTCSFDALAGGTNWVWTQVYRANSAAAGAQIGDEIVTAVAAAGPRAPAWSPPAGTIALPPADCDAILPATPVGILLGVGVPLYQGGSTDGVGRFAEGGWYLPAAAFERAGAARCYYGDGVSMAFPATMEVLPAGAWAWREIRPLITEPAPARVEIALLGEGDEAWVRCTTDGDGRNCVLDLVAGENWIRLEVWDTELSGASRVTVDPRAGILRLGEAVLGELQG